MSEPLKRFRTHIREMLADGIKPTATNIAIRTGGMYVTPGQRSTDSGPTMVSGKYNDARIEEMLKAGWRRMMYNPKSSNHRWVWFKRETDFSEGHYVRSQFRVGDRVRICNHNLIEANDLDPKATYLVEGYEAGWHLDRPDLPEDATALVLRMGDSEAHFTLMVCDDEIILVEASEDWPLFQLKQ